mgnify:CR=1 FL=1
MSPIRLAAGAAALVTLTAIEIVLGIDNIVFIAILSTLMIPTEMLVIPWYLMSQQFGWLDTYWGIMFPGLMTAFGTFLMKQFFETVPDDFIEAARIDGLNELQIWWTVAMPLVMNRCRKANTMVIGSRVSTVMASTKCH